METVYRNSTVTKADKENRTVVFKISDSSKDRHGTVLNMDNWNLDHFNANGIVGYQHDVYGGGMCNAPDPDAIIGKGKAWVELDGDEKVLMGSVEFEPADINPKAEKIYQKVLNGTLKATSVGFRPIKDEKGKKGEYGYVNDEGERVDEETFYFYGQELLEFSIVSIPANPNALKRSLRNQTTNALQYVKRELGISYGEIENMTVRDVIDMLEDPEKKSYKDKGGFNHLIMVKGDTLLEKIENAKSDIVSAFGGDETEENDSTQSEPEIREGQRQRTRARALKLKTKI